MKINKAFGWMLFCLVLLSISACSKSNLESTIDMPAVQAPVNGPSENNELTNLGGSLISGNEEITPENIDKLEVLRQFGRGRSNDIALSPDGRHLAVSSQDGIYIYSVPDLAVENFISAGISHEIVFSLDGNLIVASIGREDDPYAFYNAGGVIVFDVASGKELWNAFFEDPVDGLLLSPNSQTILVKRERSLDFLDAKSGKKLNIYEDPIHKVLNIQGFSFSSDSSKVAIFSGDTIHYIDAQTLAEFTTVRLQHDFDDYGIVAFSTDFQYLVNTLPSSVRVWNAQTGEQLWAQTDLHQVSSGFFSEDGRSLAIGCENQYVIIMDSATGDIVQEFQGKDYEFGDDIIDIIELSAENKIMATLSAKEILLWDLNIGMEIGSLKEQSLSEAIVAASADGKLIAAGYSSGVIRVWEAESAKLLWQKESVRDEWREEYSVNAIKFSSDGKTLMVKYASTSQNFRIIDSFSGKELNLWDVSWEAVPYFLNGNTIDLTNDGFIDRKSGRQVIDSSEFEGEEIRFWALSPDGSSLAISSVSFDKESLEFFLRIWDTESGEVITTIDHGKVDYNELWFSPDGKILSTKAHDAIGQTIVLWKIKTGERVQTFPANEGESLLFSPDGQIIFLVKSGDNNDGYFSRLRIKDGSLICKSENVTPSNFTLSSNGEFVTFFSYLDSLTIWDAKSCKFSRDTGLRVESATFSEDGKYLITGGQMDGLVELWGIP